MAFNVRELPQILPNPGDKKVFEFVDKRGISYDSPWGVPVPDLTIACCKTRGTANAKHYKIVNTPEFVEFIYECVLCGASYTEIDEFFYKLVELKTCVMESIRKYPEITQEIRKIQIMNHKDRVLNFEDLKNARTPVEAKMAEVRHRSRINILTRFDPEFKNTQESNISNSLAKIILAAKESEDNDAE